MATARKKSSDDAIDLLMNDHKEAKALFRKFDKLADTDGSEDEKQAVAEQVCQALKVHTTIEEELFYPAAREILGEDADLVDEADVEHASAKDLIAQVLDSSPEDDHYDAKVRVLGEYIDHHVQEEENEMFPKLRKLKLDTASLGALMAARKEQLVGELAQSEPH